MICFLKGQVADIGADYVALDVNGVGYQLFCSARTLGQLEPGHSAEVHTHLHVREDQMTLFGFADTAEKELFLQLTSVNGVGVKVALALLSSISPRDLVLAVTQQDAAALTQAPGVGKKLAERLVLELKSKLGSLPIGMANGAEISSTGAALAGGVVADVRSALFNLGYKPQQADRALEQVMNADTPPQEFDDLLKATLAALR